MTMIYVTLCTWLIPHLIANSSASVEVTLMVWWIVLAMILLLEQVWYIEVAMLFLILASEITITVLESKQKSSKILSSLQI